MSSELAKTISTTAIWLSTAIILTFGVCRMNEDGPGLFLCLCVVIAGATIGTAMIWAPWTLQSAKRESRGFEVLPAEPSKD